MPRVPFQIANRFRARRTMRGRLGQFLRDRRGTVAIEFAFALPITCMMVFGLYEITEGVITYMKVAAAANTVEDLIGQASTASTGIGVNEINNYYIAAQIVMYPNLGSDLGLAITSVYYDSNGANPTVAWSVERGGAPVITNPTGYVSGLGSENGSMIIVQATYTFISPLGYFITSPITITSKVIGQPRNFLPGAGYDKGIPCPPTNGSETCN